MLRTNASLCYMFEMEKKYHSVIEIQIYFRTLPYSGACFMPPLRRKKKKSLKELFLFLGSDLSKRQDFQELSKEIFLTMTGD